MKQKAKIILLAENKVEKRNLIAEHGLSFYISYKGKKYLFDTGQGLAIFHNANKINIGLEKLDAVILSHGHDDHSGGLRKLLKINNKLKVISHPKTFLKKYKIENGEKVFIGSDIKEDEIDNLVKIKERMEIDKGIFVTGEVKTKNDDYINDKYLVEENGQEKIDDFADDMSLYFETAKGIVILLGCSHKGVINIIKEIEEQTNKKIRAILGGMHLKHSSDYEIDEIVNYLKKIDFDFLAPIHCTGNKAAMKMKKVFGDKVNLAYTGDSFSFNIS